MAEAESDADDHSDHDHPDHDHDHHDHDGDKKTGMEKTPDGSDNADSDKPVAPPVGPGKGSRGKTRNSSSDKNSAAACDGQIGRAHV